MTNLYTGPVPESSDKFTLTPNDILRFFLEIFAVVSLAVWGFASWPVPWNIVLGIVLPLVGILLWALFRSPKAVFSVDVFGKALVEIAVMGAAALAWWDMDVPVVAIAFGVLATVSGVINGRRELG
ncbi:YrdB family protein [Mycetocola sp.]|uniref:YrdB family protein n=1 Tax=Mycetocola sp. TaxID=1871042 RepID=UPI00398981D7